MNVRRLLAKLVVALGCFFNATCDGTPPIEHPQSAEQAISPLVKAKVAELEKATTLTHWALYTEQTAPANYQSIHRKADVFQVGTFDEVRAYYHGLDAWHDEAENVDTPAGCVNEAVAPDGRLCPSVVLPGTSVPIEVGHELITLFNTPAAGEVMCQAAPKLSFVYRYKGVPVGELSLDLNCPRWSASPGSEKPYPSAKVREQLVHICHRAGLFWCSDNDPDSQQMWSVWRQKNMEELPAPLNHPTHDKRRKTAPLPVAPTTALSNLTVREQTLLCAWNMQHVGLSRAPGRDHAGLVMPGSTTPLRGGALGLAECVEKFPKCTQTLGEIAACQEAAQKGDLWFVLPNNAGCKPMLDCRWGFQSEK
ncbi:MAG: hypothetical protein IPK82_33360 [Polyangiaceae bacterium]|nr:hypothetical protein [Polyangiaceae bacterium]